MAKKVEKERNYNMDLCVEPDLDIEAILNEEKPEYHLRGDKITVVDKNFCTESEVRANMSDYNRSHKAEFDTENIEKRKKLARRNRKRTLETIIAAGLIIMAGIFFALVLYPQAELSELSRDNSEKKDEIAALKKEILDAKGESNGIVDMDSIRAQAMALGMQEPNSNQIVNVPVPGTDRLISVATYDSNGISDDALDSATENLRDYYHEADAEE